jgi:hypothetical protein
MTFAQKPKTVTGFTPVATDANPLSAWVDLSRAIRCKVVILVTKGNAALTSFTLRESTDGVGAGAGVQNIPNSVQVYSNLNTGASQTDVRRANAVTYALDNANDGRGQKVIFDVDPAKLSINNGYRFLAVQLAAGDAANIASISYELDLKETN